MGGCSPAFPLRTSSGWASAGRATGTAWHPAVGDALGEPRWRQVSRARPSSATSLRAGACPDHRAQPQPRSVPDPDRLPFGCPVSLHGGGAPVLGCGHSLVGTGTWSCSPRAGADGRLRSPAYSHRGRLCRTPSNVGSPVS